MPAVHYRQMLDGPPPASVAVGPATLWYLPAEGFAGPRPALVWIHGGAWRGGDASVFWPHMRYFASRGFASFSIGYRKVAPGGFTIDHTLADTRAAFQHLMDHAQVFNVDPRAVVVGGDSAGGHLAACLTALPESTSHPAGLVLCNPVIDTTEDPWPATAGGVVIPVGTPAPAATPTLRAWAMGFSPLHQVLAPQPPTLLLHGDADTIVPLHHAQRYHARLAALGADITYEVLPGARHAFIVPRWKTPEEQVVEYIRRIDAWLTQRGWISGEPTLEL